MAEKTGILCGVPEIMSRLLVDVDVDVEGLRAQANASMQCSVLLMRFRIG